MQSWLDKDLADVFEILACYLMIVIYLVILCLYILEVKAGLYGVFIQCCQN